MRKNILLVFLSLLIIGIFLNVINISTVGADSGFDSSYDSGGSWDSGSDWSGSDWDSGSSWDSSGSGNLNELDLGFTMLIFLLIFVMVLLGYFLKFIVNKFMSSSVGIKISNALIDCSIGIKLLIILIILLIVGFVFGFNFIILIIIYIALVLINKYASKVNISIIPKKTLNKKRIKILSNEDIIERVGKDFNIENFKNEIFNNYKELQTAWMNFDYNKIKELVSDEMYNMYTNQLETLKIKNQQNIMSNIKKLECEIMDCYKINNKEVFKVYLKIECYDYIINIKTNKVVRGKKYKKLKLGYVLTFERNIEIVNYCPRCGAKVKNLTECSYCKSKIINNNNNLKMTKKEIISQK